jgi:hypothetical protein
MTIFRQGSPFLTLFLTVLITTASGCAVFDRQLVHRCNSHAYTRSDIEGYVAQHFRERDKLRVAVLPFVTAPQFEKAGFGQSPEGLGFQFGRFIQAQLMEFQVFPVVEFVSRAPSPGAFQDMFAGNYHSITWARDAGYDFVVVGLLEPLSSVDSYTISGKLIDTSNGVTIWYGRSTETSYRNQIHHGLSAIGAERRERVYPDYPRMAELVSSCLVKNMMRGSEE